MAQRASDPPEPWLVAPWIRGLLLLALLAPLSPQDPAASPISQDVPDVVLITLDTLRADALGFAGNEVVETPTLDRLAAGGKVFPFAHAHNVVTLPSHTNILTGLLPYQHGVRDNDGFRLADDVPTLATRLQQAGWATGAFVAAYPLDASFGLDRGFDVYDDTVPRGEQRQAFVLAERRGDAVVAAALDWWHSIEDRPRFLWLHLFDPHAPYDPPEPFASRYAKTPYLGEVAATDHFLTPLLGPILDAGAKSEGKPTWVVVTSDHGEALGDHGELTHGLFAYEPTLRVPLVVWGPGVEPGEDPRAARHVDIVPTLLDALDLPKTPAGGTPLAGRSLLEPWGAESDEATYFEAMSASLNRGWAPLYGQIRDGHKLIALPLPELYDLPADPGETTNRVRDDRARAAALRDALPPRSQVWPRAGETPADTETSATLQSLGYLGGSATIRESYGPEDDPKRLVDLDRAMHRTIELYSTGQLGEAVELARSVVAKRPTMALGQSLLAQALLEAGQTQEAIVAMGAAQAQGAADDALVRQLGLTLAEVGRHDEALALLTPKAATDDAHRDDLTALATALSETGRQDEAAETLARVLDRDGDDAPALEQLALVELRRERWSAARDAARRAVTIEPGLHQAWNNLGVALDGLGDVDAALDAWQRAVEIEPQLFDALYNLGARATRAGRADLARPALERFVAQAPEDRYAADLRRARVLLARLERQGGG